MSECISEGGKCNKEKETVNKLIQSMTDSRNGIKKQYYISRVCWWYNRTKLRENQ